MIVSHILTLIVVVIATNQIVDSKPRPGEKATMSGEPTHFQVDDRAAEIEVNANAAGTKVIAKPASLQVVAKPGAPAIPVTHPMIHLAPHFGHSYLPTIHHQPARFYHGGGMFGMSNGWSYMGKKKAHIPPKKSVSSNKTKRKSTVPKPDNSTSTKTKKGGSKRQFINNPFDEGMVMPQPILGGLNTPLISQPSEMVKEFGSSLDNPTIDPRMLGIEAPVAATHSYQPVTSFETSGPQSTEPNFTPPLVSMGGESEDEAPQARSFLPTAGGLPMYGGYPGVQFPHLRMHVPHFMRPRAHRRHLHLPYGNLAAIPRYPGTGFAGYSGFGGYGGFAGIPGIPGYPAALPRLPMARSYMPRYVPRYKPRYTPMFLPQYKPVTRTLPRIPMYRTMGGSARNIVPVMVPQYAPQPAAQFMPQPAAPFMPQPALPAMYAPMYPYAAKRGAVPNSKQSKDSKVSKDSAKVLPSTDKKNTKTSASTTDSKAVNKNSENSNVYKRNNIIGLNNKILAANLINKLQKDTTKRQMIISPPLSPMGSGGPLQAGMMQQPMGATYGSPGPLFHSFPYTSKFGAPHPQMFAGMGRAINPEMGQDLAQFNGGMGGGMNPGFGGRGLGAAGLGGLAGALRGAGGLQSGFARSGLAVRGFRPSRLRSRLQSPMGLARAASLLRRLRPQSFLPLRAPFHQGRPLSRSSLYSLGSMGRLPMMGMRRRLRTRRPWRPSFVSPNLYRRRLPKHYESDDDDDDDDDDADYDLRGNVPEDYQQMVNNDAQTRSLEQNIGIPISVEAKTAAGMLKQRLLGEDDDDKKRSFISKPKRKSSKQKSTGTKHSGSKITKSKTT